MLKSDSLLQAYQHCQDIANQHYENFPTASLLLRADLRAAIAVIYAFAREADDFADEGDFTPEQRIEMLDDWEKQLDLCLLGQSKHPIFTALADVMQDFELPEQLFRDLLTAFRMDVHFQGFANLDALKWYAKHSADPIGRLMLALHGIQDKHALDCSDAICTALQLTNFWQDFSRDLPNQRCYLATEWLELAGVNTQDLLDGNLTSPQLQPAIQQAILSTEALFQQGYGLLPYLPLRLRIQIAATLAGGLSILHTTAKLEDPLHQRPKLNTWSWLKVSLNIALLSLFPRYYANKRGQT
ncbi:MAG: squalene synthase HpnC [Mariprofundaceae bacterium]|nr:squalene synthase HpnC [Mariprofundaceae bacterium]